MSKYHVVQNMLHASLFMTFAYIVVNIREGGIDKLLEIYKELRVIMDDYITGPGGTIYMSQVWY